MSYYLRECAAAGFTVEQSNGVDDALQRFSYGERVDVAVVDVLMPPGETFKEKDHLGLDTGYLLATHLRDHYPQTPVVILTNAEALTPVKKFQKLSNVKSILFKPDVCPSDLVAILAETLDSDAKEMASVKSSADEWKALIDAKKREIFSKFLASPAELTQSEFLLLSEVNHKMIRQLVSVASPTISSTSKWTTYTLEQLATEIPRQTECHLKGEILEELSLRLFNAVPGFRAKSRLRTETEELDLFILNGSTLAPWRDMGPALIGECKNWTTKCGVPDYNHFETKIRDLHGQCRCGFFISWNGFTEDFIEQRLRSSREGFLILLLDGDAISSAVRQNHFPDLIEELWQDAVTS